MPLILRAIITGFGYKLGAELARYAATRVGLIDKKQAQAEEVEEDLPEGIPLNPDDVASDPEDEDADDDGDADPSLDS